MEIGVEGPLSVRVESSAEAVVFHCCDSPQSCQPLLLLASPHTPPSPRGGPVFIPGNPSKTQWWCGLGITGPEGSERGRHRPGAHLSSWVRV